MNAYSCCFVKRLIGMHNDSVVHYFILNELMILENYIP